MVINKGGKVAEKDLVTVIELLMNELVKLDGIVAEGDVKLQSKMQVCKIKKIIEAFSMFLGLFLVVTLQVLFIFMF